MMQSLSAYHAAKWLVSSLSPGLLTAAVVALAFVAPARAITIENLTTGTLLFSDDFETSPNGVSSSAFPDHSTDNNPDNGVLPGNWLIVEPDVSSAGDRQGNIQVINRLDSPDRGPLQGLNYLRVGRADSDSNPSTDAMFEAIATAGQMIRAELMFSLQDGLTSSNGGFYLRGDTSSGTDQILTTTSFTPGGTVRNHNGLTNSSTTLTYNPTEWNHLILEYTVGSDVFTVTVNGVSETLPTRVDAAGTGPSVLNVDRLRAQGHHQGAVVYVDAVPEPQSIVIAALGALGFVFAARKARRS